MLNLLNSIEAMSGCRDRERLPEALLSAVGGLFGDRADVGLFAREAGLGVPRLKRFAGSGCERRALDLWLTCLDTLPADGSLVRRAVEGFDCGLVALHTSELCAEEIVLAFVCPETARVEGNEHEAQGVLSLARIYGHQLRLLDYGELDTLTRLLNRKTFDETFDRLIQSSVADSPRRMGERRHPDEDQPAWLCVIDIDHFKRINDTFGHLFGDEVLLRLGDQMRRIFRGGDRLFRFGGEEFVVLLNAESAECAAASFERFRHSVENHEFPQVGQVTCSIGFTAVQATDVPTDVMGRADQALYFAKANGRNRVCDYEALVAAGAIAQTQVVDATPENEIDIDALFD